MIFNFISYFSSELYCQSSSMDPALNLGNSAHTSVENEVRGQASTVVRFNPILHCRFMDVTSVDRFIPRNCDCCSKSWKEMCSFCAGHCRFSQAVDPMGRFPRFRILSGSSLTHVRVARSGRKPPKKGGCPCSLPREKRLPILCIPRTETVMALGTEWGHSFTPFGAPCGGGSRAAVSNLTSVGTNWGFFPVPA